MLSTACCDIGIDLLTHLFRQLRLTIHVYEDKEFAANPACAFLEDWPCQSSSDELTIRFDPVINAQTHCWTVRTGCSRIWPESLGQFPDR